MPTHATERLLTAIAERGERAILVGESQQRAGARALVLTRLSRARDTALLEAEAIEQGPDAPERWDRARSGARERHRAIGGKLRTSERNGRRGGLLRASSLGRRRSSERPSDRRQRDRGRDLGIEL